MPVLVSIENGYPTLMYLLIGGLCAVPVCYACARVASIAWHKGKLAYQRRLVKELTGGVTDGKSVEE